MSGPTPEPPLLELRRVSMWFGGVQALADLSLALRRGEVLGLIGDNGAGKSTLLKIITGVLRPTSGAILLEGSEVDFRSPTEARSWGIETVYQDLALVDRMSLWRNFFLGKELRHPGAVRGRLGMMQSRRMKEICEKHLTDIGLQRIRSANQMASVLSGGERQSLAITRAVFFGAKVLLLDEPTAALSVKETGKVFDAIAEARSGGLGVIYVDHNMAHVYPLADRIAVVEHGRVAALFSKGEVSVEDLVRVLSLGVEKDMKGYVER
jgi:simple sugar transport system ATP-binding protein